MKKQTLSFLFNLFNYSVLFFIVLHLMTESNDVITKFFWAGSIVFSVYIMKKMSMEFLQYKKDGEGSRETELVSLNGIFFVRIGKKFLAEQIQETKKLHPYIYGAIIVIAGGIVGLFFYAILDIIHLFVK